MNKPKIYNLTAEITNQCNLHCRLCRIWKEKNLYVLKKDLLANAIASLCNKFKVCSVSLTGGEPFLHPQFNEIFKFLILLRLKKMINYIGIYTNGYAIDKIMDFLKANRYFINGLNLGISIDGLKQNHNYLRGSNNAFKNTLNTIKKIKNTFSNQIKLEIKFTISDINYNDLLPMYNYCKINKLLFLPKLAEFNTKNYYHRYSSPSSTIKNPLHNKYKRLLIKNSLLSIFTEQKLAKERIVNLNTLKMLVRILEKNENFIQRCDTPSKSLFIASNGSIFPCIYLKPIANINDLDFINKIFGNKHQQIIKSGENATCPHCYAYHGFLKELNYNNLA